MNMSSLVHADGQAPLDEMIWMKSSHLLRGMGYI